MTRRALITGSQGFVGRVLARRLNASGWRVVGCDLAVPRGDAERRACDLTDPAATEAMVGWAGEVTHVFHLAGLTFVPQSVREPGVAMRVNFEGTVNLLRALESARPGARVIAVTSSEIYGRPQRLPIDETHPINPANPYSISKAAADFYCGYLEGRTALEIIRARPFNHSGPGQSDQFVLSSFARQIAEIEEGRREPVLRTGNLASARDFSHVNDIIHGYELLALHGKPGGVYNLCSGESHTIQAAVDRLLGLAHAEIRVETDPERWRPEVTPEVRGSHERITADTGWQPKLGFDELLQDLLGDWRRRTRAAEH